MSLSLTQIKIILFVFENWKLTRYADFIIIMRIEIEWNGQILISIYREIEWH